MALAAAPLTDDLRPLTLEDYQELESEGRERFEIINGELIVSPTPVSGHQHVSYRLVQLVGSHVDRRRLGQVFFAPMTVRLGTHDIVQPDLLFLSTAKRALIKEGVVEGTPDLVIEILSPSTQRVDLVRKRALYERAGVTEYWIVDIQAKRIRQFHLQDGHYLETDTRGGKLTSMVVIGLTIEIAPVFADLWE